MGEDRRTEERACRCGRHAADRARGGVLTCLLLGVAALLAGCTVGPSERPPVAVRGENVPAPPSAGVPTPAVPALPEPEPARSSVDFRECTGGSAAEAIPAPTDRSLRVECGQLIVEADPQQPGLSRTRVGLLRVGLADAPVDRPPLIVVGDSATQPAAVLARSLANQVPLSLLQRYSLIGLDRRGAGVDDLDCGPSLARNAFVNIDPARRRRDRRAERAAGAGPLGGAGLLPRPCRRADRLPHDLDRRRPRAGPQRARHRAPVRARRRGRRHRVVALGPHPPRRGGSARARRAAEPHARRARRRRGPGRGRRVGVRRLRGRLRRRPGLPARRRPAGRRRRAGRPSARTADHLDGRAPAHRGHDRHRAPRRSRRARRLARPGRGTRPGERRQPGRPARAPHAAAHQGRRVRRGAGDRLQRRAPADDARRGQRA